MNLLEQQFVSALILNLKGKTNAFGKTRGLVFKPQDDFVNDSSRFLAALCTRRAGKSNGLARRYLRTLQKYPRSLCPYLALTRDSAKNIMWEMLKEHTEEEKIKAEFTEHNLTMTIGNGARLQLFGADMKNFIRRLKGIKTPGVGVDECFHPDTLVETPLGPKKISEIKIGDQILNAIGLGTVLKTSKTTVTNMVEIFYAGEKILCSENHPFLTVKGWIDAVSLKTGDLLVTQDLSMWLLQQDLSETTEWPRLSVLQSALFREIRRPEAKTHRSYKESQCDGQPGITPEDGSNPKEDWTQADHSLWQWAWANRTGIDLDQRDPYCFEAQLFDWLRLKRQRLSLKLQIGLGYPETEDGHRNRRAFSSDGIEKKSGPEERTKTPVIRVDSVTLYKQGSCNQPESNSFYDLSIDNHPSFIVNGGIVHNCQDFGSHLITIVDDVLTPAIIDYPDGWIALTGTPGPIPFGYYYDVTDQGKYGFSVHKWSIIDNPYQQDPQGFINDIIAKKQWLPDHPTLLREWKGQWVLDLESLVYKYDKLKNDYTSVDYSKDWEFVVGVDLGFDDADAIAVIAWHKNHKLAYLIHEEVHVGQTITELAGQIDTVIKRFDPLKVVMDTGGLGKKIAEEMRRRYTLPIVAAEKIRKFEFIELLNDAMRMGRFFAKKESRFAEDCGRIKWETDLTNPEKPKISDNFHSDITDAVLYAYRESLHWLSEAAPVKLIPNTDPWFKAQEEEMQQMMYDQVKRRDEEDIWDKAGWDE